MLRVLQRGLASSSLPRSAAATISDQLLDCWRSLLLQDDAKPGKHQEEAVREMLSTAIRLRKGRTQNTIPDDLVATLRVYYNGLDPAGKTTFFRNLTTHFGINEEEVNTAVAAWQHSLHHGGGSTRPEQMVHLAEQLWQASQPAYSRLWVPLSQYQDGITFLVRLRADLLRCIAAKPSGAAPLRALAEGLRRSLAEWFSVGLLQLERVTWAHSSAAMLEKIMREEKVHAMSSWDDLRRRLGAARRVFVWTHPSMPGQPLVALHVALCHHLATSMGDVISTEGPPLEPPLESPPGVDPPTVAVFYSISTMQPGLAGVDLGNNLIKRVAKELMAEHPTLRTLATLSPLPGFARWLDAQLERQAKAAGGQRLLSDEHAAALQAAINAENHPPDLEPLDAAGQAVLLQRVLCTKDWPAQPAVAAALQAPLLCLAAQYLVRETRRGQALDPVAHFHLRNGAEVLQLNFLADASVAGMQRSHGVMVNYGYDLGALEANNRRYVVGGEVAAAGRVRSLLDSLRPA